MVKLTKEIPNTIIEKDHNHYGKNKSALDGERVRDIERVRNVVIICPRKHDKTKLLDSFLPSRGTGARAEEEGAGESGDLSFCYDMQSGNVQKDDNTFLINIIDSPGHADAPSKATSALTLADGAILLVDEGVSLHQGGLIKHAVSERIRPVLSLNILDSWLYRSIDDGEEVYQGLFQAIKNINEVMESYDDKLLGDLTFSPEKGTVAFISMSYGWGFTLTSFSKMLAPLFKVDEAFIRKKIWGNNFFDKKTMTWTSKNTGSPCLRGFIHFCYKPIMEIIGYCMNNKRKELWRKLEQYCVIFKEDDRKATGKELFKLAMQSWLPSSKALIGMVITHLPSPEKAQEYRAESLYKGPLNDRFACAVKKCDSSGPLLVYTSKMIQSQDKRKFGVVARVFSGIIRTGMEVQIIGPNNLVQNRGLQRQKIEDILVWEGRKQCQVQDVHPGDIIVLFSHDESLPYNATLTNIENTYAYSIRAMNLILENAEPIEDTTFNPLDDGKMGPLTVPYSVYNDLFLYQREGIHWLWNMHQNHLPGAILADDMGLGKTRQVCSFLRGLFHTNLIKNAIVVAPASVVEQWVPEFFNVGIKNVKMFTAAKTHGQNLNIIRKQGGVLLTTYGIFQRSWKEIEISDGDEELWDYVIMDEGHRAKGRAGKISEALKSMKCRRKIMMTGTPIQNNLEEFFTLVDICNPTLLGKVYDDFSERFVGPIDRGKHRNSPIEARTKASEALHELKKIVAPFVLRRTKGLLKAIGSLKVDKLEYTIWLKLSSVQRDLYKALVNDGFLRRHGYALAATDVAKDISRHPFLLMPKEPTRERKTHLECVNKRKVTLRLKENLLRDIPLNMHHHEDLSVSNKLSFIVYIVDIMIKEGHKILIFSQSPGMLVLIQNALESIMEKQEIIRMDGSTKRSERNKLRKAFQRDPLRSPSRDSPSKGSPPSSSSSGSTGSSTSSSGEHYSKPCESWSTDIEPLVFLMTTRVGGVGLNLTQASRVIIVDPSDNPSEDNQAVDRAYRYGQKNDVVVYRLMSCSDIEEHMYRSQVVKVESSIALLEEPCVRQISQRVGLVLKLPPQGFDTCKTHSELSNLYAKSANKFDILPSDLGIKHDSVVAISNHSLLFSEKEVQLTEADWLEQNEEKEIKVYEAKKNLLGITPSNQMLSTQIQISENVAKRLLKDGQQALTQIKQAVRRRAMISVAGTGHGHPQLLITGDTTKDKEKAVEIIKDFIEKVSLEKRHIIYIPRDKTGLIIGTGGQIIESIRKESGTDVQVTVPERKDLVGQNAVIISGEYFNVLVAKELILMKLRKHRVPYTEEECDK